MARSSSVDAPSRGTRARAVDASIPGRPHQNASHAAKAGNACRDQPGTDEAGHDEEPWRHEETEQGACESKTSCSNLYLTLKLQRLLSVGHDCQACLAPGIESAVEYEGLAGSVELRREPRRVGLGAGTALAVKDDRFALRRGEVGSSSFDRGRCRAPGIFSRACSSASRISIRRAPLSRRRRASDGSMVDSDIISSFNCVVWSSP